MDSRLKYPLLLVHGMGFRDNEYINYWGRIPDALSAMGCDIYYGNQDGVADIETNAEHLANRITQILQQTGAEKVNIIAHSKGGLDSRYAISVLGMADKVASLTTMGTPHHGSKTVDKLLRLPDPLVRFVGFWVDTLFRIAGDVRPNAYKVFHAFTTETAADFNRRAPDCPGVLYQSYGFAMKRPRSDLFLWLTNLMVRKIEGENDGLLTPETMMWGDFRGVCTAAEERGVSHLDEIDIRRRPLAVRLDDRVMDILELYRSVVEDLAERGF